jgi:hypothetical protein|tara:strand:- start:115 stop:444 length:330 start_codon:yes stop_codon:yes gene_type:complete
MKNPSNKGVFISRLVALPTSDKDVFMLVHVTDTVGPYDEDIASLIGPFIRESDEDGTYYIMPDTSGLEKEGYKKVLVAFHSSQVEESEVPWEVFIQVVTGKLTPEGIVR